VRGILSNLPKDKIQIARKLRQNQTDVEKKLWDYLRNRQLCNSKFRRQFPVGKHVADFCCFERRLIIEVDGGQHSGDSVNDSLRADYLAKEGYQIVRFWNHEILQNMESVLEVIARALKSPSPQSSPLRGRR
jgi:very-short-patch-repair endonuclease